MSDGVRRRQNCVSTFICKGTTVSKLRRVAQILAGKEMSWIEEKLASDAAAEEASNVTSGARVIPQP